MEIKLFVLDGIVLAVLEISLLRQKVLECEMKN
jgi:hypothetical protein